MTKFLYFSFVFFTTNIQMIFSTQNDISTIQQKNINSKSYKRKIHSYINEKSIEYNTNNTYHKIDDITNPYKKQKIESENLKIKNLCEDEPLNFLIKFCNDFYKKNEIIGKISIKNKLYTSNNMVENTEKSQIFNNLCNNDIHLGKTNYLNKQDISKRKIVEYLKLLNLKKYMCLIIIIAPELALSFSNIEASFLFKNYKIKLIELADLLEKYFNKLIMLEQIILDLKRKKINFLCVEYYNIVAGFDFKYDLYSILYQFFSIAKNPRPLMCIFYKLFLYFYSCNLKNKFQLKEICMKSKIVMVKIFIIFINSVNKNDYKTIETEFFNKNKNLIITNSLLNDKIRNFYLDNMNLQHFYNKAEAICQKNFYSYFTCFVNFEKLIINDILKKNLNISCLWSKIFFLYIENKDNIHEKFKCLFNKKYTEKNIFFDIFADDIAQKSIERILDLDLSKKNNEKLNNVSNDDKTPIKFNIMDSNVINNIINKSLNIYIVKCLQNKYSNLCFEKFINNKNECEI